MSLSLRLTLRVLGGLLLFLGALLLTPIPFSLWYGDGQVAGFALSSGATLLTGAAFFFSCRTKQEFTLREGFAVVTFGWLAFAVFGALPYLASGVLPRFVDAFFESMSGFTTAGASVLSDVEVVPKSVLFWRALTQWLGGMGIIVLGLAILPLLGVGGMQLYEAESAGLGGDRLTPRIQDTARILWGVYALLTALGIALLWLGDMTFFEAVCHAFAAVATGGFSTRNASLAAFGTYSQLVTLVLMVLGGANFALHYFALKGDVRRYWQSDEFRLYVAVLVGATAVAFVVNAGRYENEWLNLRDAAFNVGSVLTTTGFASADYERWPYLAQGLLFALMFIGACGGSTTGGLKQVRLLLLLKHAFLQTAILIHPRVVKALKLDHKPVSREIMQDVLGFTVLFLGTFVAASLLLSGVGVDLLTSGTAVIACMSTVGPGLGEVGPMDNYGGLPGFAKVVLSFCMLLGRLEISTVLVLLYPSFWRR